MLLDRLSVIDLQIASPPVDSPYAQEVLKITLYTY